MMDGALSVSIVLERIEPIRSEMGHRSCQSKSVSARLFLWDDATSFSPSSLAFRGQTKLISTAEENQQNQASLHPALNVFTKIFAGILQQQQQQQPMTTPTTGKTTLLYSIFCPWEIEFSEINGRRCLTRSSSFDPTIKTCDQRRFSSTNSNNISIPYRNVGSILSRFEKW